MGFTIHRKIADTLLTMLAWATLGGVVNAAIITALVCVLAAKFALLIITTVIPVIQLGLLYTMLTIRKEFATTIRKRL